MLLLEEKDMLVFLRENKKRIIIILALLLDGIIVYYYPSYQKINLFYPMLTISLIAFLTNQKNYNLFLLGFIYDLLYSNIFFYNAIVFYLLGKMNYFFKRNFNNNIMVYLILTIINIILYDTLTYFFVLITEYHSIAISFLIYKIKNSLILNILVVFVYYFLFKKDLLEHTM